MTDTSLAVTSSEYDPNHGSQQLSPPTAQRLWTISDVGNYFSVPAATVRKWLQTDQSFPRGVRVGKHRRWTAAEILAWEDQLRFEQSK